MKKWWLKNKKRILLFATALMVSLSSVPCVSVRAEGNTFVDSNNDKQMTLDEVNIKNLVAYGLTAIGFWANDTLGSYLDSSTVLQSWCESASNTILGYLSEDGNITLSDETWQLVRSIANALRGDDGYTVYPALNSNKIYWLNAIGATLSDSNYNKFVGSSLYFATGTPIATSDTKLYVTLCNSSYFDCVLSNTLVLIMSGSDVCAYYQNGAKFTQCSVSSGSYVNRDEISSSGVYNSAVSWTTAKYKISPKSTFRGLVGVSSVVFDSSQAAAQYYTYDRSHYYSLEDIPNSKVTLSSLNSTDWLYINQRAYDIVREAVLDASKESGFNDSVSQQIIAEYTKEILADMDYIKGETIEQTSILHKIYDLLIEWFPKLSGGSSGGTDVDPEFDSAVEDFEEDSNGQSEQLGQLVEDSKVEKPDIESVSSSVDSNIDMDSVGQYGVLLSSVTTNPRVVQLILISLSVSLIVYVFFGKR